jgi:hypothetical protein
MTECPHEHRVCDTPLRTFLIVATGNALEYVADVFLLLFLRQPLVNALGGGVGFVAICYATTYIALRIWGKVKWGRKVLDMGDKK